MNTQRYIHVSVLVLLLWLPSVSVAQVPSNPNECVASSRNQTARVRADGSFIVRNVPANVGLIRVTINCDDVEEQALQGQSFFVQPIGTQSVTVPPIPLRDAAPAPIGMFAEIESGVLSGPGDRTFFRAGGNYSNGEIRNLTYGASGTTYRSSNESVAVVDPAGLVKANGPGLAILGVSNQGRAAAVSVLVLDPDTGDSDGDGMTDACELEHGLDPGDPSDADEDPDVDGLINLDECINGSDPFDDDTDDDGVLDGVEVANGTDPVSPDTDQDGLTDGEEAALGTDPLNPFSDAGCLPDGYEVDLGLNPLNASDDNVDTDSDGALDCDELVAGSDPTLPDTDADGIGDFEEINVGIDGFITDPTSDDTDGDGLVDPAEVFFGSSPVNAFDTVRDAVMDGVTLTIDVPLRLDSLTLINGAFLTHTAAPVDGAVPGLALEIANTLTVDAASRIDVSGRGYRVRQTLGNEEIVMSAGGSYGGLGGLGSGGATNEVYGDYRNPNELGSAGTGLFGGGLVRIVADTIVVDGIIKANALSPESFSSGGGSGGGIRIDVNTLSGTGDVQAIGGNGISGLGGGGGRIAIYYDDISAFDPNNISARGGVASGGAGTLFLKQTSQAFGDLFIDNDSLVGGQTTPLRAAKPGRSTSLSAFTLVDANASFPLPDPNTGKLGLIGLEINPNDGQSQTFTIVNNTATEIFVDSNGPALTTVASIGDTYRNVCFFDSVTLDNTGKFNTRCEVHALGGFNVLIGGGFLHDGEAEEELRIVGDVTMINSSNTNWLGTIDIDGNFSLNAAMNIDGTLRVSGDLVFAGGSLWHSFATTTTASPGLTIDVGGSLVVAAGALIDVRGRGYIAGQTLGHQTIVVNGGGGYGGDGHATLPGGVTNPVYGDYRNPNELGSGGSTFAGGGRVQVVADTLQLDGQILADAANAAVSSGGGGSGGAIRIDANTISGSGAISAVGGTGNLARAGGGGRIAIYYGTGTGYDFSNVTARGDTQNGGGPGTIYLKQDAQAFGDLISDGKASTGSGQTTLRSIGLGRSATVADFVLTDPNADFRLPDPNIGELGLIGLELNPNTDQSQTFTVVGNTATQLFVDPNGPMLTSVASLGDEYIGVYKFDDLRQLNRGYINTGDEIQVAGVANITDTVLIYLDPGSELFRIVGDTVLDSVIVLMDGTLDVTGDLTATDTSFTLDGTLDVTGDVIATNTSFTHSAATMTTSSPGLDVIVGGTFTFDANSTIDVSGKGFTSGQTLGHQTIVVDSGGSYGGDGQPFPGGVSNPVYGDYRNPNELGSGGSARGGGGRVHVIADTLQLEGQIVADAANAAVSSGGGGSGGAIRIDANTISGSGAISAVGGNGGNSRGGGGGRIAIYYGTGTGYDFSNVNARGDSQNGGAAGTIYLKQDAHAFGDLIIDEKVLTGSGQTTLRSIGRGHSATVTDFVLTDPNANFRLPDPNTGAIGLIGLELNPNTGQSQTFTVVNNTATQLFVDSAGPTLTSVASSGDEYVGVYKFDDLRLLNRGYINTEDEIQVAGVVNMTDTVLIYTDPGSKLFRVVGDAVLDSVSVLMDGTFDVTGDLTATNTSFTHFAATQTTSGPGLSFKVGGTFILDATSKIDASGKGFPSGQTLGNESVIVNAGGTYGGVGGGEAGGGTTNPVYGDFHDPRHFGSGGAAQPGGGTVRVVADTLQLDGDILADASFADSFVNGGGSGGSIRVDVNTLAGTGLIHARGGAGISSRGGGGGRIAIYFNDMSGFSLANVSAQGGASNTGGAGTIYLKQDAQLHGDLIVSTGINIATPLRAIGSGQSTALSDFVLTDANASFLLPDPNTGAIGLIGLELNPDMTQSQAFTIVDNTATAISVDPNGPTLTSVAASGDDYIGVYSFDDVTIDGGASVETQDQCLVSGTLIGSLTCEILP